MSLFILYIKRIAQHPMTAKQTKILQPHWRPRGQTPCRLSNAQNVRRNKVLKTPNPKLFRYIKDCKLKSVMKTGYGIYKYLYSMDLLKINMLHQIYISKIKSKSKVLFWITT